MNQSELVLRGNHTARIDEKGRLKIPKAFLLPFEVLGAKVYVTSLTGENVRLYPLPEWKSIEQRLMLLPSMEPARRRFLDRTNYYGREAEIDRQGRVLIHRLLRNNAGIIGDAVVLGYLTYLEVWEIERFKRLLLSDPYTEETEAAIARLGI